MARPPPHRPPDTLAIAPSEFLLLSAWEQINLAGLTMDGYFSHLIGVISKVTTANTLLKYQFPATLPALETCQWPKRGPFSDIEGRDTRMLVLVHISTHDDTLAFNDSKHISIAGSHDAETLKNAEILQ